MLNRGNPYSILFALSLLFLASVATSFAQVPKIGHVFIVLEENANYSDVLGNPAMPYLNSLANKYGLATNYFADTRPSIGNYFMLTTGQVLTNDDSQTPSSFPVAADNLVREILAGGKTWKDYAESLPSLGYLGGDSGQYAVHHNPFPYFTDVQSSPQQQQNLVPFEDPNVGFAHDLANQAFPNFSFIAPNLCDDAHDCPLSTADTWLQANIAPLVSSALFQSDGLLVIVFDESNTDKTNGGGRVALLVISPKAKQAYQSTMFYQHESVLRLMCEAAGCAALPGAAAQAPDMAEFFGITTNPLPPVAVLTVTPQTGTAPLPVTADSSASSDPNGGIVSRTIDFGDGTTSTAVAATHTYNAAGAFAVKLSLTDNLGLSSSTSQTVTVLPPPPSLVSVTVSPASATVSLGTPQQFTATGTYNDNSTQNLTSTVTWSSTSTTVATINTAGLATTLAAGSTTIQASSGSISGSATLTVNAVTVAVTLVNTTKGTGKSAPAQNHTAGNLLVVVAVDGGGSAGTNSIKSIADTAQNIYTLATNSRVQVASGVQVDLEIWYAKNITGNASNVVTVTWNKSANSSGLVVLQYSGADTVNPFEVATTGATTGTSVTSNSFAPAASGNVDVAGGWDAVQGSLVAGANYKVEAVESSSTALTGEDRLNAPAGAQTASISDSGNVGNIVIAVASFHHK